MHDVVVIGAGPAGSVAALEAARNGFSVLLLEKERLPRYKLCGGAISKKTLRLLEDRGIVGSYGLRGVVESAITKIKITTPRCTRSHTGNELLAIMTYRDKFDNHLTEKAVEAGVEVKDGVKVYEVMDKDGRCVARSNDGEYQASYIFGADGINGPVRRNSGLIPDFPKDQVGVAGEFELMHHGGYEADQHSMEFHYGIVPFGYGWVFPKGNALTVGVANLVSELRGMKLKEKLYEFADGLGLKELPKPGFHLIPIGGFKRRIASDRILLCGDAAGFVDMTAGEGTYYAIQSGILAAEVLREVHDGNGSLIPYQRRCEEVIIPNLRGSLKLARWLYKHLDLFYYMVENEPGIMPLFPTIAGLDKPFEDIYRRVLLLGAKNYVKRLLRP
ncbi:MAG: geranylgeranyl reductase family protein [Candidatus Hydrothermarchaeaceae archaeon]